MRPLGCGLRKAALARVEFDDCRLSGADFSGAKLSDVCFRECRLADASFRLSTGDRVRFEGCDLRNVDFYAVEFPRCVFLRFGPHRGRVVSSIASPRPPARLDLGRGARGARLEVLQLARPLVPLALQVLQVLDIKVDDEREPTSG